jgi:hypothetical protein
MAAHVPGNQAPIFTNMAQMMAASPLVGVGVALGVLGAELWALVFWLDDNYYWFSGGMFWCLTGLVVVLEVVGCWLHLDGFRLEARRRTGNPRAGWRN